MKKSAEAKQEAKAQVEEAQPRSVPLTSADHNALREAFAVLLSPLDSADPDEWRGEVERTLASLLGADRAAFQLRLRGVSTLHSEYYSTDVLDSYLHHYMAVDVGRIRRDALGLEVWNRELLHGPHLRDFFESEIHQDFLVPNKILDSMGLTIKLQNLAMPITLFLHSEKAGTIQFGVRGVALLNLLRPAFKAGVRDFVRYSHQRPSLASHLDSMHEGVRISDLQGRVLHQNSAFTAAVSGKAEKRIETAITEIIGDLTALTRKAYGNVLLLAGAEAHRSIRTRDAEYLLQGRFFGGERVGSDVRVATSLKHAPIGNSGRDSVLKTPPLKLGLSKSVNLGNPSDLAAMRKYKFLVARSVFSSNSAMAEAFGVDRSNMTRWKRGAGITPENLDKIEGLETVVTLLVDILSPSTIPKWLRGINAHLNNRRPLDVLMEGRLSEVIAAVENERSGAFA